MEYDRYYPTEKGSNNKSEYNIYPVENMGEILALSLKLG